jgi:hypothetical protein
MSRSRLHKMLLATTITVWNIAAVPAVFFLAFAYGMGIGVLSGSHELFRFFSDASLLTVFPFGIAAIVAAWVLAKRDSAWSRMMISIGLSLVAPACAMASVHFFYG